MTSNRMRTGLVLVLQAIASISLLAIMLYTVANVASRTLGMGPLPAVIELITRWWMVPLVFAGWVLAHVANEHIRVEFVSESAGIVVRGILNWVNSLLLLVFLALVAWGSWLGAQDNRFRGEFGIDTGAPVWLTRYVVPVMAVVFILVLVADLVKRRSARGGVTAEADGNETLEGRHPDDHH